MAKSGGSGDRRSASASWPCCIHPVTLGLLSSMCLAYKMEQQRNQSELNTAGCTKGLAKPWCLVWAAVTIPGGWRRRQTLEVGLLGRCAAGLPRWLGFQVSLNLWGCFLKVFQVLGIKGLSNKLGNRMINQRENEST